jgi:carboxymethylenebutenolidase
MGDIVTFNSESGPVRAYLVEAPGSKGPGILLCHAWWGLTGFFTGLADRLSAEGYTVLAPDLFDGRTTDSIPEAEALVGTTEADGGKGALAKEQAALDYLLNSPALAGRKVAAVGFSMGAAYVTWLATLRPEIAAVVVFYGASEWNADYHKNATAPIQGHWAAEDQFESIEDVPTFESQVKAAGHIADFHTYPNTQHWFFENNRPEYNPEASALAWQRTLSFLRTHLS